jgi:hypothetical protein
MTVKFHGMYIDWISLEIVVEDNKCQIYFLKFQLDIFEKFSGKKTLESKNKN